MYIDYHEFGIKSIPVLRPVTDFLNIKSLDENDLAVKPIVSPSVK